MVATNVGPSTSGAAVVLADGGAVDCASPAGMRVAPPGTAGEAVPDGATTARHATAVPSSSTIWPGTASRVTPSIVVGGATPAAASRDARTP